MAVSEDRRWLAGTVARTAGVLSVGTDAHPGDLAEPPDESALFREQAELIMQTVLASGAVILGRAGAAAFQSAPGVLRVRLSGLADARITQALRFGEINEPTAQWLAEVDRARRSTCGASTGPTSTTRTCSTWTSTAPPSRWTTSPR
jgi:hypothetical protein